MSQNSEGGSGHQEEIGGRELYTSARWYLDAKATRHCTIFHCRDVLVLVIPHSAPLKRLRSERNLTFRAVFFTRNLWCTREIPRVRGSNSRRECHELGSIRPEQALHRWVSAAAEGEEMHRRTDSSAPCWGSPSNVPLPRSQARKCGRGPCGCYSCVKYRHALNHLQLCLCARHSTLQTRTG